MGYQPNYVGDGQEIGLAERDCATRYEAIRDYLRVFGPTEGTVLDFGAAEGYFACRLAEDFPNLRVIAIDNNRQLPRNTRRFRNVQAHAHRVAPRDLPEILGGQKLAAVLLLSVLHHVPQWQELLYACTYAGAEVLFVELAEPEETLPRALAHHDTADMHAVIGELDPETLAETTGYRSNIVRRLQVCDLRPPTPPKTPTPAENTPAPVEEPQVPVLVGERGPEPLLIDEHADQGYEHPEFPTEKETS